MKKNNKPVVIVNGYDSRDNMGGYLPYVPANMECFGLSRYNSFVLKINISIYFTKSSSATISRSVFDVLNSISDDIYSQALCSTHQFVEMLVTYIYSMLKHCGMNISATMLGNFIDYQRDEYNKINNQEPLVNTIRTV